MTVFTLVSAGADTPAGPAGADMLKFAIPRGSRVLKCPARPDRGPGGTDLLLTPEVPAGSEVESVSLDGAKVECRTERLPASVRIALRLRECSGRHIMKIRYTGGVDWLPVDEPLNPGATSGNLRLVRARWEEPAWRFRFERLPGREYPVEFQTDRSAIGTSAGQRTEKVDNGWRVTFTAPANSSVNAAGFVGWDAGVEFGPKAE